MNHAQQSTGGMRRALSFHLIKPEHWDRYKYLRGGLAWGMIICSVGSAVNWYNWVKGAVHLDFPVFLTLGTLAILMIVPKKWELVTWSAGGVFVLSILATLLRRMSLALGLEVIAVSGGVYFLMLYIQRRLAESNDQYGGHNVGQP